MQQEGMCEWVFSAQTHTAQLAGVLGRGPSFKLLTYAASSH